MGVKTIGALIEGDTVSVDPQTVFDRNTNPRITNVNQIPKYLYMCLSDMFQGPGKAANWPSLVTIKYGLGAAGGSGIDLIYQTSEAATSSGSDRSDITGAEYGILHTLCKVKDPNPQQKDLVDEADLRIRYLIDCLTRQKWAKLNPPVLSIGGIGGSIDTLGIDNTIDPSKPFYCRWLQFDMAASDAHLRSSIYTMNFYRLFF